MKKFLAFIVNWGLLIPVAAIVVSFALSNRDLVTLDLWPLDLSLSPPLYLVVLLSVLAGFLIGLVVMWISAGRARARARREAYRAKMLERELNGLKAQQQAMVAASSVPSSSPRSLLPSSGRGAA